MYKPGENQHKKNRKPFLGIHVCACWHFLKTSAFLLSVGCSPPCQSGGMCDTVGGGDLVLYICRCPRAYAGSYCQYLVGKFSLGSCKLVVGDIPSELYLVLTHEQTLSTHTHTHTHTHTMHDCFTIELAGECLKCLFRLTGGAPAVVVQSEARWARIPEIQVRIPSRAMGTFFPHTVSSIFRLSLTHTHRHARKHIHTRTHPRL